MISKLGFDTQHTWLQKSARKELYAQFVHKLRAFNSDLFTIELRVKFENKVITFSILTNFHNNHYKEMNGCIVHDISFSFTSVNPYISKWYYV